MTDRLINILIIYRYSGQTIIFRYCGIGIFIVSLQPKIRSNVTKVIIAYEINNCNLWLIHRNVALFGCGDAESYPDTFCGGMKELYDAAKEAGANVLEGVSTESYTFDDSDAVVDGKFVGLALDDINEDDKTEERIDAWLASIKPSL